MKKTIIAAFSALALLVPNAMRADEPAKEYNMVITLQNGTTITLGHNDIKNITFNGEEISIAGNAANTIQDLEAETQRLKEDLANVVYSLDDYATIAFVFNHIDELRSLIDAEDNKMLAHVAALEDYINMNRDDIANLKAYVDSMMNSIANLEGHTVANEVAITTLNQSISDIDAKITNLEGHTVANEATINTLNQFISDITTRIYDQQGQIDHLNMLVDELNKKLTE